MNKTDTHSDIIFYKMKKGLEDDDILFSAMAKQPKLMERPIAVTSRQAFLGWSPEKVFELIK